MPDIKDLKFVRTFDFRHIPRKLFEQVKGMEVAEVDRIYTFGSRFTANPLTLLYVLVNDAYEIKGVLWANIDIIEAVIFIRLLSIDKEYQNSNGQILNKVKDFLFGLKTGPELKKKIYFLTSISGVPSDYEKFARRSKRTLLEITDGKNNKDSSERDNTPDTSKPAK